MALHDGVQWTYVNLKDGSFCVKDRAYNAIDGRLQEVTHFVKSVGQNKTKHALRIALADLDGTTFYSVESGMETQFGRMFAGFLQNLNKDDHIRLRAKVNDQNHKGASCFLDIDRGNGWQKGDYVSIKDNEAAIRIVEGHACYKKFKPKDSNQQPSQASKESCFQQFLNLTSACNWPNYGLNKALYFDWFQTKLFARVQGFNPETMDDGQWAYVLSCVSRTIEAGVGVPKALANAVTEEFDPFAE